MTRHQRRKAAKNASLAKAVKLAEASKAFDRDLIVKRNLQRPIERNYYPQSSMADMAGHSHRGYVCRASGAMSKSSALALKAKGAW